jgi:regulator of sigma E protease
MFLTIFVFILIIGFLIFFHEFGHFLAAKKNGVLVEEFGFGFPPRIFAKKIGNTLYSLNLLPFGGFVKISEEDPKKEKNSFYAKSPKAKATILLAGVVLNFLIAIVIFYFVLGFSGFKVYQNLIFDYSFPFGKQESYPEILFVAKNSPAEKSGLKLYDLVLSANGTKLRGTKDFINFIEENKGKEISLRVKNLKEGSLREIKATPRLHPPKDQGPLGIGIGDLVFLSYPGLFDKTISGFLHTFNLLHFSIYGLGHLIKVSFLEKTIQPIAGSLSGPVGILAFVKLTLNKGVLAVLNLVALISLGLALVNILPIPAADGGRLVFVLYEAVFRKQVPLKLERNVNLAGIFILVLLLLLVTYKDIIQFKEILF